MYTLTTPSLLFSAVSLVFLAYTNRFIAYAALVRSLSKQHEEQPDALFLAQIDKLCTRLHLVRAMQVLGLTSLIFCVLAMFLLYIGLTLTSLCFFGLALLLLGSSLTLSVWEVVISMQALELHLRDVKKGIIALPSPPH